MSEDNGKSLFETHEIINENKKVEPEQIQEPEQVQEVEDRPKVRIAAFDVGIKTLSFTILEYILDSDRPPKIIIWRVLNLLDQNDDGCIHNCLVNGCDKDAIRGRGILFQTSCW
jgi:hypothetical protein